MAPEHTVAREIGDFTLTAPETATLPAQAGRTGGGRRHGGQYLPTDLPRSDDKSAPDLEDRGPEQRRGDRDQPRKAEPFLQDHNANHDGKYNASLAKCRY